MPNPNISLFPNRNVRPARTVAQRLNLDNITRIVPTVEADAIFEGGATLGAAYVGSLTLLENAGVKFKRIAGNSAGAITAGLVAAGYKANEIEWLMSNFPNPRISKPATLQNISQPIDFMDFLDFPAISTIRLESKRKTMLWKFLKGEIIDELLNKPIPIPTREDTVNLIIAGYKLNPIINAIMRVPGMENAMRNVIGTALIFLPTQQPTWNSFNPFQTEALRIQFADQVWDILANKNPLLPIQTQFTYEGSFFEGENFLNNMNALLSAKLAPGRTVLFRDLPIPLAVISFNYTTGKVVVYSSQTHLQMSVAEAARRSMSLPLIFQPRKVNPSNRGGSNTETMIDGGVGSNFPIWLFNDAGNAYWPQASISPSRIKIGLSLDEKKETPRTWNVNPPKFNLNANGQVDVMGVVKPIFISKIRELFPTVPLSQNIEVKIKDDLSTWKFIEVLLGFAGGDKEEAARQQLLTSIMQGKNYFDISIPLLGFHGFDFSINGDRDDMDAIAERGFVAAFEALKSSPLTGTVGPIISNTRGFINPYH